MCEIFRFGTGPAESDENVPSVRDQSAPGTCEVPALARRWSESSEVWAAARTVRTLLVGLPQPQPRQRHIRCSARSLPMIVASTAHQRPLLSDREDDRRQRRQIHGESMHIAKTSRNLDCENSQIMKSLEFGFCRLALSFSYLGPFSVGMAPALVQVSRLSRFKTGAHKMQRINCNRSRRSHRQNQETTGRRPGQAGHDAQSDEDAGVRAGRPRSVPEFRRRTGHGHAGRQVPRADRHRRSPGELLRVLPVGACHDRQDGRSHAGRDRRQP